MSASLLTNSPTIPGHSGHSDGDSDGDNYSDDDDDGDSDDSDEDSDDNGGQSDDNDDGKDGDSDDDSDDDGDDHYYDGITRSVSFCGNLASACQVRFITTWIHHPQQQSKGSPRI